MASYEVWVFSSLSVRCTSLDGLDPEAFQELQPAILWVPAFSTLLPCLSILCVVSILIGKNVLSCPHPIVQSQCQNSTVSNSSVCHHGCFFFLTILFSVTHSLPPLPHPCGRSVVCLLLSLSLFSLSTIYHFPHVIIQSFPADECNVH